MTCSNSIKIFKSALHAVQPDKLIAANLHRNKNFIAFDSHQHTLDNNVYVVGFGKAVSGMCRAVQNIIGDHIVKGALSIPYRLLEDLTSHDKKNLIPIDDGKIAVYEGAEHNQPDQNSLCATKKIIDLCRNATEKDLVVTLVSGGGSALLPAPMHPLTLQEKSMAISKLIEKGATIQEINKVRINLSLVKGGQLASLAWPAKMWSFILSDIVGDPMELIASGPTVSSKKDPRDAINIIEKYKLKKDLTKVYSVLETIESEQSRHSNLQPTQNVFNKVVGNNALAVDAAVNAAANLGYHTVVFSQCLVGESKLLGAAYADLSRFITNNDFELDSGLENVVTELFKDHGVTIDDAKLFSAKLNSNALDTTKVCIISGGESTVTLTPNHGAGGRNQEMVLSFALKMNAFQHSKRAAKEVSQQVIFLSGGTDGQDGPTSAAGAVFSSSDLKNFNKDLAQQHLDQHDSYHYFKKSGGLLEIGLTGINVMDIQILLIERNQ